MKKKVKIIILACMLFLGIGITATNSHFSQTAFASMGSTGGGGTSYTSSSSSDSSNFSLGSILGDYV